MTMTLKTLSELAALLPDSQRYGEDVEIAALAYDSRQVVPGALFIALSGAKSDGHDFIAEALGRGAAALAIDSDRTAWYGDQGVPVIAVPSTRAALPVLASHFYDEPSRQLQLIGVTGTNGKTTTAHMIESIFRILGDRTGLIGTLGGMINGKPVPLERTTPESADLQRMFAEMLEQGVRRVVMEVSSEGALQGRTTGCAFDIGVFTNLTQDHLNTHGTMEAYFEQKLRLFTEYPDAFPEKVFTGVVNGDDEYGVRILAALEAAGRPALRYSMEDDTATIRARIHEVSPGGTRFDILYQPPVGSTVVIPVSLRLGGLFNVANALAAAGAAIAMRVPPVAIQNGLEALGGVPGRFETVETGDRGFHIIVDYAHTPDGLQRVLESARALKPARLISVFGCGGDRDPKKRPIMGKISFDLADITIVTSDNPRTENPDAILEEIVKGIPSGVDGACVFAQVDRRLAIKQALCEIAQPGDLVVIAGKGHESGQQFAHHKIPFDDRQVAREVLEQCS
ncbi:UDP-N-acetylmuramoyl-L-alanyl-D-glutamate--2,6-diaminopimelate ligase [Capsulimonas corticalis]|uniref:UDP-N-acetylmuramoyl-L-alanyl-D-glutamate--2,6-diaminopimelate ligase n=1 Tax=Capsulimonas corticalis TaxID=2219043 RepID=A0A402D374_9BACT|nr:UDP-N-acetylmuramoyl-L-alanyl-D-glutamate--2,6-diaminopimelate ligase [Capsulimonas corticalis]BDI28489.1 UDP-N-acetylmuramoyl-L-alanyl-D-glutamate--2,6-diaminopimelate ligase [Capsulimonas corticalis]